MPSWGSPSDIEALTAAGGVVEVDEKAPGRPVVRVDFEHSKKMGFLRFEPLGDEGLAGVRPHLESLPQLRYLRITSMAMISDAGLKHLEGLTQLGTLELYSVDGRLTQAGVDRLKQKLPNVQIHYSGRMSYLNLPPMPKP